MWNFTFRSRKTRYIKHLCRADLPLPVQVCSSFFASDSFFARFLRPFIRPFGMDLRGFTCRYVKPIFQRSQHLYGFADLYGDTWRYENRLEYADSEFHVSHLLISGVLAYSEDCPVRDATIIPRERAFLNPFLRTIPPGAEDRAASRRHSRRRRRKNHKSL